MSSREGWKEYKIREIGVTITGKTPLANNPLNFGDFIPFVTPTDFSNYNKNIYTASRGLSKDGVDKLKNKILPENSILVTCIGSQMGKTAMNKVDCVTNQQLNSIIPNIEKVNPDYLYYKMSSLRSFLRDMATGGSTMPIVNKRDFEEISILIPNIKTQQKIASILSSLDDKIELNRQMNESLEEIAQSLFDEKFIKTLDPSIVRIDEYINFNPRLRMSKGNEIPFVEMKYLPTKGMNVSEVIYKAFTAGSKYQKNDTLLARITPCLENGKTAFVNFLEEDAIGFGSTEFIVMRAKEGISPQFVYCLARNEAFRQYAINSMVGSSGRQRIQLDMLVNFEIPKIDVVAINKFDDLTKSIFEQINSNRIEIQELSRIRDILLPKLMSGEIEV